MPRSKSITVESAEKQIQYWTKVRDILLRISEAENDDLDTRIIKKYLKLGSVVAVATELNTEGILTTSKTTGKPCKFISNDISEVIREHSIPDIEMLELARTILADHSAFINRMYN